LGALASLYISPLALLPGHLIYGVTLSRYPRALKSILRTFGWAPAAAAAEPPNPPEHMASGGAAD
jgi:hypothetical protein